MNDNRGLKLLADATNLRVKLTWDEDLNEEIYEVLCDLPDGKGHPLAESMYPYIAHLIRDYLEAFVVRA